MLTKPLVSTALFLSVAAAACGGGSTSNSSGTTGGAVAGPQPVIKADKNAYPVFVNADAGADPTVPADKGGKGFTGQGWQTNTEYDLIGDPRAVKGGMLRDAFTDFPSTLRYLGPNITAWNAMLHNLVYETLLGLHPTSLDYMPGLATHWQIGADKKTFRFRLDPNARFADNTPVTADDVIASWKLVTDRTVQDPARTQIFLNFETPVAESKYLVSVKAKTENWQNFLYFSNVLYIYPAHVLKGMTGADYIRDYNYKMLPGTGPYEVTEKDVEKGKSIVIRRRPTYWAEKDRRNIGLANFDEIRNVVVRDRNLEFEMFKKGDLDYYVVNRAQMWAEQLDYPNIKRGLNQKRKIFNHNPSGVQGIAMNTRRTPYDDIRVRKALRLLFNRESMVEKLMYNQYILMDSVYPGSVYENPGNEKIRYDPAKALQLLTEAGWKDRNPQGRLVKNGQPMTLELLYADQASERYFTIYQEDLRKVGITLNLRLVTFETLVKLLDERTFDMVSISYTGELFPSPEMSLKGSLADEKNTNNITGFKNARADQIIDAYQKSFDMSERIKLLRELDGIFTNEHHWILEWTSSFQRLAYWNKFGQPAGILTRIGDSRDIPSVWWIDPDRSAKLDQAQRDSSIQLGEGASEDKTWLEFAKLEEQANAVTK